MAKPVLPYYPDPTNPLPPLTEQILKNRLRLYNFCLGKLSKSRNPHEIAEDIVQETVIRALTTTSPWDGRSSLNSWMSTIAVNLINDYYRRGRNKVEMNSVSDELLSDRPSLDPVPSEMYRHKSLLEEMSKLPGLYRLPVLLKLDGYDTKEMAGILNINEQTVKSRLHRAKAMIRTALS